MKLLTSIFFAFGVLLFTFLVQVCQSFHVGTSSDGTPSRSSVGCWSHPNRVPPLVETTISTHPEEASVTSRSRRRMVVGSLSTAAGWAAAAAVIVTPTAAVARYVLDDETGEYVEVDDVDWQTAWKQRLDKASSMSTDDIFQAARGAGNAELRSGPESEASKKRRALSGCRDATVRRRTAGAGTEKECTARVLAGDVDFMLDSL